MEDAYNCLSDEDKDIFWEYMDDIIMRSKRFRNFGKWIDLYDMEETIFALTDLLCYND